MAKQSSSTGTVVIRLGVPAHTALVAIAKSLKVPAAHYAMGVLFGADAFEVLKDGSGKHFPMPELAKRGRASKYAGMTAEQVKAAKRAEKASAEATVARMQANENRLNELRAQAQAMIASGKQPNAKMLLDLLLAK